MKYLPLTQTQLGMFLEWNADRTSVQYNLCADSVFPTGTVDAVRLAAAVKTVLENYPIFRMHLSDQDGEIVQFVDDSFAFAVETRTAKEAEMPQVQSSFRRPFDPFVEPMARAEIVTTEAATHLLTDFFHLIYDGTSEALFFAAVSAAYEDRELPHESMTFADSAALEPSLFEQDAYKTAKEEHAARFAGKAMTVVEAEETGQRSKVKGLGEGQRSLGEGQRSKVKGQTEEFNHLCLTSDLGPRTSEQTSDLQPSTSLTRATTRMPRAEVEAFCRANEIHPNLFFMGAFARTLALYANTTETVFYTVNHGRRDPRLRDSLGAYVKTVPVLAELKGDRSLVENLKSLKLHHVGDYPFTHFCRDLGMKPGFGYVFQDGTARPVLTLDGVSSVATRLSPFGVGRIPTFQVWGDANGFTLDVSVLPGDYSAGWCAEFVNRIAEVARQFLSHSDALLKDVPILSCEDEKGILALGAGATRDYDKNETFVDLFLQHVKATPDAKAVVAANGTLTYGELDAQSSALAAALALKGVKPGDFVAVKLGRVKEFPLAVIGIWKAGAAYVPVDPEYPEERIAYMLEDSGAKVVIDEAFLVDAASSPRQKMDGSCADRRDGGVASTTETSHFSLLTSHLAKPSGLAYMIYTSGSTGKPKGVMVTHANLRAFLAWLPDELGLKPGEAVAEHASFSFDASICDLYTSLSRGATLHILSSELRKDLDGLAKYLSDNRIVGATLSTQLGMELLNACDLKLRYMVLGGEKLKHVRKTSVRLYNGYGPTEFTCWSSHHIVDQEHDGEDIPIGRPVPNTLSAIVDKAGNLLPRGMIGELVLAGAQISRGYWNRPELTAERFVALPWLGDEGQRSKVKGQTEEFDHHCLTSDLGPLTSSLAYRTGDLARWDENGELLYCGRIDNQVKLRGFRIEMGEIEAAMAKFPGIAAAVADVKKIGGVERLVGYYVASAAIDETALREFLSQSLAEYMVPDTFMRLDALPLTPNGKVDRKRLPVPEIRGAAYVAPEGAAEIAVAAAMADVLNLKDPVGRDDDFLSLGGDSIKSIRLVSKIRAAGVTVSVADIMKAKTVKGIAALAKSSPTFTSDQSDWSGEVPLTAVQALFFREWNLAKPGHFNQSQMLTASERLDADVLKKSLEALARHHDMLRAVYAGERQRVRAVENEGPLCELRVVEGDDTDAVARESEVVQASFDLEKGPLFKAVLFKGKKADHVLLVVHHFVVDGVSWRILFEDLETAYGQLKAGAAVRLPPKTMSFRDWRAAVGRYAERAELRRERNYWRDVEAKIAAMPHTAARSSEMREFERTVAAEAFAALRGRSLEAYHTEINDLMLTALGRASAAVTGERALSVDLEGHGREPLHEETQIDRTVGWFTAVYPIVVETTDDLRASIRGVKEMLRRVPNHGLGYGILRHVAQGLLDGDGPVPAVSFNYLGTLDEGGAKGLFAIDDSLPQGRTFAAENVFGAALAVNCWGRPDGTLRIIFTYDAKAWSETRAVAIADGFVRELEAIVTHTLAVTDPERTASDLGETTWSDAEFQSVELAFASRGETLERIYPLMPMQEGMLLEALSEPSSCTYNLAMRFALDVQPQTDMLERVVARLLAKHEVLRTAIIHEDVCEPRQAIVSGRKVPVTVVDLTGSPNAEAEAAAFARREFERPIDVRCDPLFRVACIRTSAATCQLLIILHHIVVDGWCMSIYLRDLQAFLREEFSGGARPDDFSSQSGRYERHVRDIVRRDRDAALAYWRGLLDGYETKAEIPVCEGVTDANRAASNELRFVLPAEAAARLTELCRSTGCTVNNAVEAAWGLVLQKYNRTDDAVFVKVVSGRDHARENVSDVVGLFINSVPVRVQTPKNATLLDLVKAQQRQAGETIANDWMSLAEIQRESALGADLFQSILAFENYETGRDGENADPLALRLLSKYETNVAEIALEAFLSDDRLGIELKFDAGKYTSDEMTRLMDSFKRVLCALAETPDLKACEVSLLDDAGEKELIALGTGEKLDYDRTTTFLDLFEARVKEMPDAKAVVAANGTLTYGELDAQSSALAAALALKGVKPGDFVAVKLGRVKEFPLAVIGIWKAGAAYVPVDPEYPEERIAYMLEDSGAKVVIDEAFLVDAASSPRQKMDGSCADRRDGGVASTTETSHFSLLTSHLAKPSGLAYMIYTSGSTGKPKGVAVTHANLRCFIEWLGRMVNVRPGDQIGEFVSFSFDGSTGDLYPSLANGATLHILSSEIRHDLDGMRRYIAENRIRGMVLVTSMAVELLADGEIALDYLLVGGERVVPFRPIPTLNFYNVYGPTEFTNMAVTGLVDQTFPDDSIPIGRPVPGTLCAIVDPAGNLMPRGAVGELVLAGPQLSRGYWKRPELTAERFVALPWLGDEGQRSKVKGQTEEFDHHCLTSDLGPLTSSLAYRTGDLARWDENGELLYCGRIDNQVKLRGFRIEMGEIESAMARFPGIASAFGEIKKVNGVERLVGYYVASAAIDETALRLEISHSLTDYMIPDTFMRLEKLPLTPNGKVDRKRLPVPEIKADEIVAPASDREKAIFGIVAEQLGTEAFGVTTNLISMGLTSLGAIRLSAAIKKATGFALATGEILAKPRIRDWTALESAGIETIAVLPSQATYPLTANQLGIYLDWARNRQGLQYNVPSALRFEGADAVKLREAVSKAVSVHPYFKVRLEQRDGLIVQVRRDDAALAVSLAQLDHDPDAAFFQSRIRPFDLLKDDLARFEIYAAPKAAYLFVDIHHILFDGGSANVLMAAIRAAWSGEDPAPEAVSAYDYALHDAAWQSSEAFAKAETYFDGLIAGTESFVYPPKRSGAIATGEVATVTASAPLAAIRAKCRALGVTENAFFATAFCETLRRASRTDDIQIATVSNGRSLAQLANSVGMFVETLPLVSRRAKGSTVEAVRAMQAQIAETIRNDRYPFTKLVERHGLKPNVLYVFQGDVLENSAVDLDLRPQPLTLSLDTAKVPLALNVMPKDDFYELVFEYDAGLYGSEEIGTLAEALRCLLESLSALGADAPISQAELVDRRATDDLLALGQGEKIDYDRAETFLDLFAAHVKVTPDAKAVVAANGTLTYGELDAQSSALAAELALKGVKPGDFVAVKLGRVKEFPLSVIAIWKAGAAYVPVDPEYPEERIAYMLEDSGAKVVIDEAFLVDAASSPRQKMDGSCADRRDGGVASTTETSHFLLLTSHLAKPSGLAYMIYTSGSTGKPKGVMVSHANLRAFLAWRIEMVGAKSGEAFAHYTSFSFDASLDDLATPLAAGSTLHILSENIRLDMQGLRRYLVDNAIVGLTLPTQFGMQLLNDGAPPSLRYLMMGGEKLKKTKKSSVRVINGYGPTEFTVCSSYHVVDSESECDDIPIGRPVPNTLSAIVDKAGNLLPRGMVGELVLAGAQLSRGYWNRPELTAERFVALPWLGDEGQRSKVKGQTEEFNHHCLTSDLGPLTSSLAYRTGDLARWNEDGELVYCGRIDNLVKLRGFRIEMGEIESAMAKFPGIAAAVADVKKVNGVERLVGYYVASTIIDEAALHDFLSRSLADYMIPDAFMRLDKFPLTPNGKVDRKALPIPALNSLNGEYVEPVTVEERALCAAYGRVLKLPQYGAETDFFRAGGSSLDGIRLVAELQRLGFKVVYGDLFKHKTPRALASFLASDGFVETAPSTDSPSSTAKLQPATFAPGSYDYAAIDALLARTPTEPCEGVAVYAPKSVLLTGVTGYLGIHVLKQLLEASDCRITVLVRPKCGLTVERRVTAQYFYYFEQMVSEVAKGRLSFVEGDITDADLAGKLADVRFDTLFNCAALVKHYVADDLLDRVNVEGVRNLVNVCEAHDARLMQMSTASVGGVAVRGTMLDERHLYIGQMSGNDYVRTKFEAERLVLEAIAAGRIRGKVMRLGNLMGRETDGIFQMNFRANAFINAIRSFVRLEAVMLAYAAMRVEFSQIDLVAEAVVKLSMTPDPMVVFHPFSPCRRALGSVIDEMNILGRRIEFVSKAEFEARVDAMRSDPARAKDLQGLLHYRGRNPEDRRPVEVDNDWTTAVLRRLGFVWKPPADGYLERFFRFLDGLQFFD